MTHASSSANQSKAEPFPASSSESETETPGGGEPAPGAGGSAVSGDPATVPLPGVQASPGTSEELPVVQGLHVPDVPQDEVDQPDR